MRERPILFSAPMVRAILDGRKTQTRRLVKPQPPAGHSWHGFTISSTRAADEGKAVWARGEAPHLVGAHRVRCPYGQPGDTLWVRESFMPAPMESPPEDPRPTRWNVAYAAGGQSELMAPAGYDPMLYNYERWTPSIHMPRWASRITLEVTVVRVERLQDISEADARAEGAYPPPAGTDDDGAHYDAGTFRDGFRALWESINGSASWDANPWVWVIEFKRAAQRRDEG